MNAVLQQVYICYSAYYSIDSHIPRQCLTTTPTHTHTHPPPPPPHTHTQLYMIPTIRSGILEPNDPAAVQACEVGDEEQQKREKERKESHEEEKRNKEVCVCVCVCVHVS